MLPKIKRLNLSKDFKWVRAGKVIHSAHFQLFGRYGENEITRVGVAIASKVLPKATLRNKARRKMFRIFEEIYPKLPQKFNIMALPKAGINEVKSEDLKKEVLESLEKIV